MIEKKIYFVVNQAAFFVSHRLELALNAKKIGWNIELIISDSGNSELEKSAISLLGEYGISCQVLKFTPSGKNLFRELYGLIQLFWVLRKNNPDIVHTVTPKCMMFGGVAARLAGVKSLVLAVSGMGYLYTGNGSWFKKAVLFLVDNIMSFILSHPNKVVIVQNKVDFNTFSSRVNVDVNSVKLIPGSGVHLKEYEKITTKGNNTVVFPARLLKDKGVVEFVESAKILKQKFPHWRFILAGDANHHNPSAIGDKQAKLWVKEGFVEWYGHLDNMISLYEESDVICLPSYREGMPKTLLEAAAASKPIVTTDTIGCNEAIIDNKTGILVPVKNIELLVQALEKLMLDENLRSRYGLAGRELAKEKFSIESVVKSTFSIYESLS